MKPIVQSLQGHRLGTPQRGFTLVELMVGLTIGLLSMLVIASVLMSAEGSRRSSTSGSDAQVNGGLATYAIQRQLKMAGYGLTTAGQTAGCTLSAQFAGANVGGLPPTLAPAIITAGANGAPDTIRILSAATTGFSLPTSLVAPFYNPTLVLNQQNTRVVVRSAVGINAADLLALVYGADQPCQIFQATSISTGLVTRLDSATWNTTLFPSQPAVAGAYLVNLGTFNDITFSLTADQKLRETRFDLSTQTTSTQDLQSNIVAMKALYGKDTNANDVVDTFDTVTPANNAGWLQVRAVRLALVARSAQYEKDIVTQTEPTWDVGTAAAVAGSVACGASQCLTLKVSAASDWQHYRYKVFEMLVPLRNQVWRGDFTGAPLPLLPASGGVQ